MIKIIKSAAPRSLTKANSKLRPENEAEYLLYSKDYDSGRKTFGDRITKSYRSKAVKDTLKKDQHNKCCFSEAKFVNDDFHVEHFRPKAHVDTWPKGKTSYPGYYWMAYEWDNLFLCKSNTNSGRKRNFFPLKGKTGRNKSHLDTKVEVPYLIDPSIDQPRDHIRFKDGEIFGKTDRGRKTIQILNLRNGDIDEVRRTKFELLKALRDAVDELLSQGTDVMSPKIQGMIALLRASILPSAEYSSMATDLLSGWPHL
jgi:uncharacterized protein (TIGR02646 family)